MSQIGGGVSILETCWRAHITIVTLCHPFVVYHTCTIWWEGTKTTQISSRGPKGVEEEHELICHQYSIMGQIIWLYLTSKSIQVYQGDLLDVKDLSLTSLKKISNWPYILMCQTQVLDIKQNHMSWPITKYIYITDCSYSSIDVALIFPRTFFWYFTDENA